MLIVGERINSSRKPIQPAIESKDVAAIQDIARRQVQAGATHIDVNAGTFISQEPEYLEWLERSPIGRQYREELDELLRRSGRRRTGGDDADRRGLFRR